MILDKYTHGFVAQRFDTDKEEFVAQEFVAGDDCVWENADGEPIDSLTGEYLPFDMVQPKDFSREKLDDIREIMSKGGHELDLVVEIQRVLDTNC